MIKKNGNDIGSLCRLVLFGLVLFSPLSKALESEQSQMPYAVQINEDHQLSCLLEPSERVLLSSSVAGVIAKVHAERGETVTKGQVLFTLNDSVQKASVETYKARMAFNERKLARNKTMFDKKMLSGFEIDELETEYGIAQLNLKEAEAKLKLRAVRSPIDGIVVRREVSAGEFISEQPAMVLAALNPLHAEVVMQADYFGAISEGMKVAVEVLAKNTQIITGEVKIVDRVIDGASGTFGVRIVLHNPENRIPAGLKCRLKFNH